MGGMPDAWLEGRVVCAGKDGDRLDHRDGIKGARQAGVPDPYLPTMDGIVDSPCAAQVIVTHGFATTFVGRPIRVPLESAGCVNFRGPALGVCVYRNRIALYA